MKFITTLFCLLITISVMGQQRVITNTHVVDVARGQLFKNRDVYITRGKISAIKKHKTANDLFRNGGYRWYG